MVSILLGSPPAACAPKTCGGSIAIHLNAPVVLLGVVVEIVATDIADIEFGGDIRVNLHHIGIAVGALNRILPIGGIAA